MESVYTDYARVGSLIITIIIVLMIAHEVLVRRILKKKPVRRLSRSLQVLTAKKPVHSFTLSAPLLLCAVAILWFFLRSTLFSLQKVVNGGIASLIELCVYWVGVSSCDGLDLCCTDHTGVLLMDDSVPLLASIRR